MSDVERSGAPKWKYFLAFLLSVFVYVCLAVPLLAARFIIFQRWNFEPVSAYLWSFYLITGGVFSLALCVVYRRYRSLNKQKAFNAIFAITAVTSVPMFVLNVGGAYGLDSGAMEAVTIGTFVAFVVPLMAFHIFVIGQDSPVDIFSRRQDQ